LSYDFNREIWKAHHLPDFTDLAEPEEIILPETRSGSSTHEAQRTILVAPAPYTRMRGVKSYLDKSKNSKVVSGNKSSVIILDIKMNTF